MVAGMSSTSSRVRAEAALAALREIIFSEVAAAGKAGVRNSEVARSLGLETSVNGGQRNHLTHALLNGLVASGRLARRNEGAKVIYSVPSAVHPGV